MTTIAQAEGTALRPAQAFAGARLALASGLALQLGLALALGLGRAGRRAAAMARFRPVGDLSRWARSGAFLPHERSRGHGAVFALPTSDLTDDVSCRIALRGRRRLVAVH